jgi:hypothetical protein
MESLAMYVRFLVIAATALSIGAPAVAEPSRPAEHETSKPSSHPAQVVLASADQAQAPTSNPDQAAATPVKHPRAARVSSCRCGGQVEQPDDE